MKAACLRGRVCDHGPFVHFVHFLPRQARDNHRENSEQDHLFSGEERPDGMIRLDDWRALLLTGRSSGPEFGMDDEDDEAEAVVAGQPGEDGAPLSGHAGGFAKLTEAQVTCSGQSDYPHSVENRGRPMQPI
jgi:hypothetical protein